MTRFLALFALLPIAVNAQPLGGAAIYEGSPEIPAKISEPSARWTAGVYRAEPIPRKARSGIVKLIRFGPR